MTRLVLDSVVLLRSMACRCAATLLRCNGHCLRARDLQRLFHGQSFPTSVDETGRLVLPAKLRKKIELEDEAFFIAAGDTFQIWKPETYETEEESWQQELPDDVDPLSFLDGDMEV